MSLASENLNSQLGSRGTCQLPLITVPLAAFSEGCRPPLCNANVARSQMGFIQTFMPIRPFERNDDLEVISAKLCKS